MSEKREIEIKLKSKSAESSADSLNKKVKGIGASGDSSAASLSKLTSVAAAVGAALATGAIARYADSWTKVNNQIKQATSSTTEALAVQEAIFQIAKSSRVEIEGVASAYQRISNSVADFGFSTKDSLDVVEGLTKAFKANGASAEEAASVLTQLGQGLGAGALQGEELKAIMEASLPVSRAIAKEFGVQVGELKELGAAGELVTERVFKALQNSLPEFQSSFDKASVSIAEGFTVAGQSVTRLIGLTSEATGASESFASTLIELSEAVDFLGDAVASGAAGKIAQLFNEQLDLVRKDITTTTNFISDLWSAMGNDITADTKETTIDIGDAFLNIIPNIRTMTQVLTIELAASLDKVIAYGQATKDALTPFDGVDVDDARGALGKRTKIIDEAREGAIQSIFNQREAEKKAQTERINEAEELIEVYKRQREERAKLLSAESGVDAAFSGDSGVEIFGTPKEKPTGKDSNTEKETNSFESLKARLKLETQAIQEEAEVRRAFAEGLINQQQLDEELALQNIYYNYEARRVAIAENEAINKEQKAELLAELALQEIEAEQIKQDQLTEKTQEGTNDRLALEQQYTDAVKSLQFSALSNAVTVINKLTGESKAAAIIGIGIQTASAFVANQVATASAATLAFSSQLIPGDPTSIARATAAAAKATSYGQFNGGLILAAGAANAIGATSGGGSGGGSASSPTTTSQFESPIPVADSQSQSRVINITGLDGFGDDQPIPLTIGGLRDLLSSNEDVNIAINNGQQNAARIGAI